MSIYYFAYGSNLSTTQMLSRCPHSTFHSPALLRAHRFIIHQRGYADVVPSPPDVVHGLVYKLTAADETKLDGYEGYPYIYGKEVHEVELYGGEKVQAIVYGHEEKPEGVPREEYIGRMNKGIREACERGLERGYVTEVLRKWIPEEEEGVEEE